MIEIQFGFDVKTENPEEIKRVQVCYVKNGKEQNAVFVDSGNGFKMVEESHYPHNKPTNDEREMLREALENKSITIYKTED